MGRLSNHLYASVHASVHATMRDATMWSLLVVTVRESRCVVSPPHAVASQRRSLACGGHLQIKKSAALVVPDSPTLAGTAPPKIQA
jgi:hypothetical protein